MKHLSRWWLGTPALAASLMFAPSSFAGEPVYTNKTRFRIPFRYDAAEMQRLQAREVQLFVSKDQGGEWKKVAVTGPRSDHFDFIAGNEGEYWFAVRTMDASGRLHPQDGNIEAGLKVIVDATQPALEINLDEVEPGRVELRWTATDEHLDPSKLRIEYRHGEKDEWQHVGVVPESSGRTAWGVPGGGTVAVRGTISDQAGNSVTAEKEHSIRPSARAQQKGSDTEYRAPVAGMDEHYSKNDPPAGESEPHSPQPRPQIDPKTNIAGRTPAGEQPVPNDSFALEGELAPPPEEEFSGSSPTKRLQRKNSLVSDSPETRPDIVQKRKLPAEPPARSESPFGRTNDQTQSTAAKPKGTLVNRRSFQIGYRVDEVGASGVGAVELFITQDGGKKWYRYGNDADRKSPFAVTVPADGEFGFELRVKNGAGVGDEPPRPGDAPSIVVTVDQTAPTAQLMPMQLGRGESGNRVQIQWSATDEHLGETPILLEYAAEAEGPWEKVDDWQANSGRYEWSLPERAPAKLFLRITAKDQAGNIAHSVGADPLVIDYAKPSARIVDIEAKTNENDRN